MSLVGNFTFNNYDRQAEVAGASDGRSTAFIRPKEQGDAPPPMIKRMTSWTTARDSSLAKETKAVCSSCDREYK